MRYPSKATLALLAATVLAVLAVGVVGAQQAKPEFKLGFKALADAVPEVVGEPIENEHWGDNGDSLQQTTKGLMAWRKADNWTAFTNGSRTWINGPNGVVARANNERFDWEKEAPAAQQPKAPAATPVPTAGPGSSRKAPELPSTLKVSFDSPAAGATVASELKIQGWAVSTDSAAREWSGIEEFKAFLDGPDGWGKPVAVKVSRVARPDVGTALGNPAFANSGFTLEIGKAELPVGIHTLYVYVRSATTGWWWKAINYGFGAGYEGWVLHDREYDGFRISLPANWRAVDLTSDDLAGEFERAFRDQPEIAARADTLAQGFAGVAASGYVMLAFPVSQATTANPMPISLKILDEEMTKPVTLDQFVDLVVTGIEKLVAQGSVKSLSHQRLKLPAGEAEEINYLQTITLAGRETTLAAMETVFIHEGYLYDLSFVYSTDRAEELRPVFQRITASLQLTD